MQTRRPLLFAILNPAIMILLAAAISSTYGWVRAQDAP